MNSIILLPLLLSNALSFVIHRVNDVVPQVQHQINNQNKPIKLCFSSKYTTNNLQEISIPETTTRTNLINFLFVMGYNKTEETELQAFVSTEPGDSCAVEIYKNKTSKLFVFDYKIMPLTTCNNHQQSQIICDTGNCTNAIKCCDLTNPFCINAFALKRIMPNRLQENKNIDSCATNNTRCFSIVQMYNFTRSGDIIANSTTSAPSHSTTAAPIYSTTIVPSHSTTAAPIYSTTIVPSHSTTAAPIYSTTIVPSHSTTVAPIYSTTIIPSHSTTEAPIYSTTIVPSHSTTVAPIYSTTIVLSNSTTAAPIYSTTIVLSNSTTAAPIYSTTIVPSHSTTEAPNYSTTTVPSNATTETPSYNTTTVAANSKQKLNITILQLMYLSTASLLASLYNY